MGHPEKPMKFSAFLLFHRFAGRSVRETYDYNIAVAETLEESGFHGIWASEHHFRDYGTIPSTPQVLAYLAARTERLRLGTGVIVLPLHNPISVAEEIAQLDVLSGGRVDFGVGRGYQSIEFDGHGIDLAEARDRFDEALEIILGLWAQDDYHHDGHFYRTGTVNLVPKPVQAPHPPVYVAAVSPGTVERYAARGIPILADPAAPFRKVGQAAETWRATAGSRGSDSGNADLVVSRSVYVAPTIEQAKADQKRFEESFDRADIFNLQSAPIDSRTGQFAEGFEYWADRYLKGGEVGPEFRWEQLEVIGDPDRVIAQIQMLRDFGYSHLMADFGSVRQMPLADMLGTIRFFAKEVIPAFR